MVHTAGLICSLCLLLVTLCAAELPILTCRAFNTLFQNTTLTGNIVSTTLGGSPCLSFTGITNMNLNGNGYALDTHDGVAYAILVQSSSNIVIQNLTITGTNMGIKFVNCTGCSIVGNSISTYGISVEQSSNVLIRDNTIRNFVRSGSVVHVTNSPGAQIIYNIITNITALYSTSIVEVSNSSSAVITSNTADGITLQCSQSGKPIDSEYVGYSFDGAAVVCIDNKIQNVIGQSEADCKKTFAGFKSVKNYDLDFRFSLNSVSYVMSPGASDIVQGFLVDAPASNSSVILLRNNVTGLSSTTTYGMYVGGLNYRTTIIHNNISSLVGNGIGVYIESEDILMHGNYVANSNKMNYRMPESVTVPYCNYDYQNAADACYPTAVVSPSLPCCSRCISSTQCYGNFSTTTYGVGTCFVDTSCSVSTTVEVKLTGLDPSYLNVSPGTLSSVALLGEGLDVELYGFSAFDNEIPIPVRFDGSKYLATVNATEGVHKISISLNGVCDSTQTVNLISSFQSGDFYNTHDALYFVWGPYNGSLMPVRYSVRISDVPSTNQIFSVLPGNATQVQVPNPVVGRQYYVEVTTSFLSGGAITFSSATGYFSYTFRGGPSNFGVGSTKDDDIHAMIYDPVNKVYLAVGSTTGTLISGLPNQGASDLFILQITESGESSPIVWFQWGTPSDDTPVGAILALDGCIYVALDKSVVQYCKRIDSRDPINVSAFDIPMPNSTHIRGITEGPSGAIWVAGVTTALLSGQDDGNQKCFAVRYNSAMQVVERKVWSVNHQDNVAAIVSDLDAGIVYIGGHTFDVTGTSSALFVAQFTNGNLSIAPKTFVYRLPFPEDTASSPTMFDMAYSRTRNLLAIAASDFGSPTLSYLPTSSGLISEYVGCFHVIITDELERSFLINSFAVCRTFCFNFQYMMLTGSSCCCTNSLDPKQVTPVSEEKCNQTCPGDNVTKCGMSPIADSIFSIYTVESARSSALVPTQVTRSQPASMQDTPVTLFFRPSCDRDLVFVYNDASNKPYYFILRDLNDFGYSNIFPPGVSIRTGIANPYSLDVMFGGISQRAFLDVAYQGGATDAFLSRVYSDPPQEIHLSYSCSNFSSVSFSWGIPLQSSEVDILHFTINRMNSNNSITTVCSLSSPATTCHVAGYDSFEQTYYLVASGYNYNITSNFVYTAKILSFGYYQQNEVPDSASPIVRWNPDDGFWYAYYGTKNTSVLLRIDAHLGTTTAIDTSLSPRLGVDVVDFAVGGGNNNTLTARNYGDSSSLFCVGHLGDGSTCTVYNSTNLAGTTAVAVAFGPDQTAYYAYLNQEDHLTFFQVEITTGDRYEWGNPVPVNSNSPMFFRARVNKPIVYAAYQVGSTATLVVIDLSLTERKRGAILWPFTPHVLPDGIVVQDLIMDEPNGVLFIVASTVYSYDLDTGIITKGATRFLSSSLKSARGRSAAGGIWRAQYQIADSIPVMDLYHSDINNQESIAYNFSLVHTDLSGNGLTITNIDASDDLVLAIGGATGSARNDEAFYIIFTSEMRGAPQLQFSNVSTDSVFVMWQPPYGLPYSQKDQIYYKLHLLNQTANTSQVIYNGTSLHFNVTSLSPSQLHVFNLTAFSEEQLKVAYPILLVSTLSDKTTMTQTQTPNGIGGQLISFLFAPANELHVLTTQPFYHYVFDALGNLLRNYSVAGDVSSISNAAVDSRGLVHFVGSNDDGFPVFCNTQGTLINCSLTVFSKNQDKLIDIIILPNDDIWLLGMTSGTLPPASQWLNRTVVISQLPSFRFFTTAVGMVYNPSLNLIYVLSYYYDQDVRQTFATLIYIDVLTCNQRGRYEWTVEESTSVVTLQQIIFDQYRNTIAILGIYTSGRVTAVKRSRPNTFGSPCIMHLTCDGVTGAPTLVKTSYSNDSVSALGAVTYGDGVGIVGVTSKPFPGNLQSSAEDIYFGTERTSYSQYGFPVDTTQAFAYITSPLTFFQYIVAGLNSQSIVVRVETQEPIGPLAVTTAQPTHNSIAVELFRPANVPYVVPVTYTVIVSPEGSVAIYNYSFLRCLNSSVQLLVSGLKPGSAYLMNVSTSLGQTISTPFLTANLSPPTFKLRLSSTGTYLDLGDISGFDSVTIQYSTFKNFTGDLAQVAVANNNTFVPLTSGTTYYFRLMANVSGSISYSDVINVTIPVTDISPPKIAWTSPKTMFLTWLAVPLVENYIIDIAQTGATAFSTLYQGTDNFTYFTNLTSATQYQVRLSAQVGASSLVAMPVNVSTAPLPELTYVSSSESSIEVAWTNVFVAPHIQYTLGYSTTAKSLSFVNLTSNSSTSISGLAPDTNYTIQISIRDDYSSYIGASLARSTWIASASALKPQRPIVDSVSTSKLWLNLTIGFSGDYAFYVVSLSANRYPVQSLNATTILRGLIPNTNYSVQVIFSRSLEGDFYSEPIYVPTLPTPFVSFSNVSYDSMTVAWDFIYPKYEDYTLEYSSGTNFTVVQSLYNASSLNVTSLTDSTTYNYRIKTVDKENTTEYFNFSQRTLKATHVEVQTFNTSGKGAVYATCVDAVSGATYSFCDSQDPVTENFIMLTRRTNLTAVTYNEASAIPARAVVLSIARNGTIWFAGATSKGIELCFGVEFIFNCLVISSNGDDTIAALLEDSVNQIWVIGTTKGALPNCSNSGGKDGFAAVLSPNGSLIYLQWGTENDDSPASATVHFASGKLFVGGTTSPSSGTRAFSQATSFITEILYNEIKLGSPTIQQHIDGLITGMSIDIVSNALLIYGLSFSPSSGFVASYLLSSNGIIVPSTYYVFSFGSFVNDTIFSFSYDSADGCVVAACYQSDSKLGVYYRLIGEPSSPIIIGNGYIPAVSVFNPVNQSTEILGVIESARSSDLFVYTLLSGGPISIATLPPPLFGEVTTTSIELYWLIPLVRTCNYTLLVFNGSSFVAVQGVRPNHYVHSNLSSGTTYYFALELAGDFPKSPIHSLTVNISTMIDCVGKPVRCQNGKCAMSVLECAVNKTICSPDKPYLCFNGDCKESYKSCRSKALLPCASYTCWNGHCVANASLCDPLPSCPVLTRRCRDATCALTNETCDDSACNTLCPDGSCSPCHTTYGCPLAVPILCPNGSCVANETSCREGCNNTTYRCYDGSCLEDYTLCPMAPRLNHPIPFSYVFSAPKPKRSTDNISIPIFSDSLLSIASIEVPPSLLASPVLSPGDASPYSLAVEPVADSNLYNVGFGVWDNSTFGAALMSSVLSLSINGLTQFPDPVKITFLNELPPDENISTLCLAFINRTTQQWQRVGGVQVVNGTIIGYTSHFTEFAVMYGVKPPPVNTISRDDFEKLRHVNKNTVGIWVVSGVLAVYLAALFFTLRNDKKRAIRNSIHMSLSSPLDSPASVQLSTFSIDSSDPIVDSTPSSSVPATPEMTSSPRSPEMSNYNDTLAKSLIFKKDTDGKLKDGSGNVIGLKDLFVRRFPEKHSWLAVYFRPTKRAQLTHTDLLTLLFCMVWANLMVSSLLFTPSDPYAFGQKIVNGICVACIVFPITLIFSIMFQRMPRRYKWVTYTLAITFYLVCAILTLVETLRFGDSETKTFLVSITVSTVQDGLINQPIKLVLTCLIIILHPAAPLVAMLL